MAEYESNVAAVKDILDGAIKLNCNVINLINLFKGLHRYVPTLNDAECVKMALAYPFTLKQIKVWFFKGEVVKP